MPKMPGFKFERRWFLARAGGLAGVSLLQACGGGASGTSSGGAASNGVSSNPGAPGASSATGSSSSSSSSGGGQCTATTSSVIPANPAAPDWAPAPGTIANINLNDLSSVNACPTNTCWYRQNSGQQAPWRNWSGGVFASGFSPHGAMVYFGGGHNGGMDHSLYVFDFSSRLWSRVGPAMPADNSYLSATNYDPQWLDGLVDGSRVINALHTYNYPAYVPPGSPGVGAKGAWLMPWNHYPETTAEGVNGNWRTTPHAVDLATGQWTRATAAPAGPAYGSPYSGAIVDTNRNMVLWAGIGGQGYFWIDLNENAPRTLRSVDLAWQFYWPDIWYGRPVFVPENGKAVIFGVTYQQTRIRATLLDIHTPGAKPFSLTLNIPEKHIGAGVGVDWCPLTQKFYFYNGNNSATVDVLTPSSLDFCTCTWTWSEESFTGAAPAYWPSQWSGGGAVVLSRWRYIPALRSFAWSDGPRYAAVCADGVSRDGVMQLWRPLGT